MNAFDDAKREKLEALRRRLLERLPGMLADIDTACRDTLAAPGDAARRERAVLASHSMAGTAGTYGFPEIGEVSRDLEKALRGAGPSPARDVETLLARLQGLLPVAQAAGTPARQDAPGLSAF